MKQKIPKNAKIPFMKVIKKKWRLLVMLFPAMLFVFIFSYIPMAGIILAFKKYQVAGGVKDGIVKYRIFFHAFAPSIDAASNISRSNPVIAAK